MDSKLARRSARLVTMTWTTWTPNKVTLLRVIVGFGAVGLFGRGAWANLAAVGLTVAAIALDALDGHIARKKKMATPVGARSEEHTSELQSHVNLVCRLLL